MKSKEMCIRVLKWPAFPAMMLLLLFLVLNQFLSPGYLSSRFISTFLSSNAALIITALGISIVFIGGGMDVSMGGLLCLVNVVYVTTAMKGCDLSTSILAALAVATLGGLLNGVCVAIFRVTPLLTTFATSFVFSGLALWIMPQPTGSIQVDMIKWVFTALSGYAAPLTFISAALICWIVVKNLKIGVWIYAVGQNEYKSYASGVPVRGVKLFMYTFSGFITGIGGVALTSYVGAGDPLIASTMTMSIIAACVIGGVLLTGGIGDAVGAIFGSVFLGLVVTTVLSSVSNSFYHNFVQGVIMLVGVVGSILLARGIKNKKF